MSLLQPFPSPSQSPLPSSRQFSVRGLMIAAPLVLLLASAGAGRVDADTITLTDGDVLTGSVFSLAPNEIKIEIETDDGNTTRPLTAAEYVEVAFDGEPAEFAESRRLLAEGDAIAARDRLAALSSEDLADLDRRIREEHAYLTALARALAADGEEAAAATAALATFLDQNPRSHHTYAGREVLGDLLARQGRLAEAAAAYRELASGPASLRVRAAAAEGRLLAQAGKPDEAIRRFEAALAIQADQADQATVAQKQEASLGLARCLAATGKPAEAVTAVERLIRAADPDDEPLLAIAYVTLGACQRAAGQNDEAILSFLAVDLVHDGVPEARAEALLNLVELWQAANQPERSRAARASLVERFPESSWAKKLGDPAT